MASATDGNGCLWNTSASTSHTMSPATNTSGPRSEERGQAAADRAREILELGFGSGGRGEVSGTSNQEAAAACQTVFMTVPYAGQAEIYRSIKPALRPAALVCDTTTPLATA